MASAVTLDAIAIRRRAAPRTSVRAPVPLVRALRWAVAIGAGLSTQYLAQPFVWRQWPVDIVLAGWLEVLRDEIVMAGWLALAICLASRARAASFPIRAVLATGAIAAGAMLGEASLRLIEPQLTRPGSPTGRVLQYALLALCACGIWAMWRRTEILEASARAALRDQSRNAAALAEVRLLALRQQIEPHFLFNTLATIARYREAGGSEALALLTHLDTYLKASLPTRAMTTSLGEELALVESYLSIVAVRMSGRLAWAIDVPEALRAAHCPALAVATLVENAVKHGVMPLARASRIDISTRVSNGLLEVCVADTGVGMLGSQAPVAGTGVGLANTRARLAALYGDAGQLVLVANSPSGVSAVMRWPMEAT